MGTIKVNTMEEMLDVIQGLIKRSLGFKTYQKDGDWIIELTGAF